MSPIGTLDALAAAIRRCAIVRGDSDENVAALIAESRDLTPAQQVDMTEHFDQQTAIFSAADGRGAA